MITTKNLTTFIVVFLLKKKTLVSLPFVLLSPTCQKHNGCLLA